MMHIEQVRLLIDRQARAWERADVTAIVADFAPDAVFASPTGRWQGHQALRSAAEAAFAEVTDVSITVTRVLLDGDQGAVEWTWSESSKRDGHRRTVEDGIIFELHDDKIMLWREYFDTAAMHAPPSSSLLTTPGSLVLTPGAGLVPIAQPEVADGVHGHEDQDA